MMPIKDPMPIVCARCGKVFMGKNAYICYECRKKVSSENAKKINLNKLGNAAYSKQQAKKNASEG